MEWDGSFSKTEGDFKLKLLFILFWFFFIDHQCCLHSWRVYLFWPLYDSWKPPWMWGFWQLWKNSGLWVLQLPNLCLYNNNNNNDPRAQSEFIFFLYYSNILLKRPSLAFHHDSNCTYYGCSSHLLFYLYNNNNNNSSSKFVLVSYMEFLFFLTNFFFSHWPQFQELHQPWLLKTVLCLP